MPWSLYINTVKVKSKQIPIILLVEGTIKEVVPYLMIFNLSLIAIVNIKAT